jgi:hypothetical protein
MSRKVILATLLGYAVLVVGVWFLHRARAPQLANGILTFQGHRWYITQCLWGVDPRNIRFDLVTPPSPDGTRGGQVSFYLGGHLVTSCSVVEEP